jgi:phage shock protein PspC (stress-responsive transcriptional regulator)
MTRSFSDRLFGGVCGGLGASLRLSGWWVRAAFVALTILSTGLFAVTYTLLWWITPQESPVVRRRGFPTILALLLLALTGAVWYARDTGLLMTEQGADLVLPGAALVLSAIFFLRQLGGRV